MGLCEGTTYSIEGIFDAVDRLHSVTFDDKKRRGLYEVRRAECLRFFAEILIPVILFFTLFPTRFVLFSDPS